MFLELFKPKRVRGYYKSFGLRDNRNCVIAFKWSNND
jgi:hypothetical protein